MLFNADIGWVKTKYSIFTFLLILHHLVHEDYHSSALFLNFHSTLICLHHISSAFSSSECTNGYLSCPTVFTYCSLFLWVTLPLQTVHTYFSPKPCKRFNSIAKILLSHNITSFHTVPFIGMAAVPSSSVILIRISFLPTRG